MESPSAGGGGKFFRYSRPLPRGDFFATYVDAIRIVQLCMCPFGYDGPALRAATELLGEDGAVEEYSLLFREWEDLVSKRLFDLRGIGDDRVASSIHQFVDVDQDAEIIENIRETAGLVGQMVRCPAIVDLTPGATASGIDGQVPVSSTAKRCCAQSVDISSPEVAAMLLDKVLVSCKEFLLLGGDGVVGELDAEVFEQLRLRISTRMVLPSELERNAKAAGGTSSLSDDVLRALLGALTLSLPSCAHGSHKGGVVTVDVSVQQYYSLLAVHNGSAPVVGVLQRHFPGMGLVDTRALQALCVRGGVAAHPLLALHSKLQGGDEHEKDIYFLRRAVKLRKEAMDSASIGDTEAAILLVRAAFESSDMEDEDAAGDLGLESVDERFAGQPCVLPVYLRTQLLVQRAELHLSQGEAELCCECCDAAIVLDARHGPAYALRGRAMRGMDSLDEAVRDSLKAFLFGGSSDLALAAQAEDAAREMVRASAKDIYRVRREQLQQEGEGGRAAMYCDESFLPKGWSVRSFLSGYDLSCLALEADPLFLLGERGREAAEGVDALFAVDSQPEAPCGAASLGDIDESALDRALLPPPPEHLRGDEPSQGCWEDPYGYLLLRRLVGLFDSPGMHQSTSSDYSRQYNASNDSYTYGAAPQPEPVLEAQPSAAAGGDALVSLLEGGGAEEGVRLVGAGALQASNLASEGSSADTAQQLEQLLMSGGGGGLAPLEPCTEFVCALRLLRAPLSASLTGVRFAPNGLVHSVRPSSLDCPEGDWEDCGGDEAEADEEEEEEGSVLGGGLSHPLRARLLNVCSIVAYLAGDAAGAVQCLRESATEDPALLDSQLKLGSLLIDMDEADEAEALLAAARERDGDNPFVDLHAAELSIHRNDFDQAMRQLRAARKHLNAAEEAHRGAPCAPLSSACRGAAAVLSPGSFRVVSQLSHMARDRLRANICALLGVAQFRSEPSKPEYALTILMDGAERHPHSIYLQLCLGEVQSQAGDMVNALKTFRRATRNESDHPFPYVNAARTYQQLGQPGLAYQHLLHAISSDPAVAMARVDLALNLLQQSKAAEALSVLDVALRLARHVSEIHDVCTAAALARLQLELKQVIDVAI